MGWDPFDLMELPVPEYERSHLETCAACRGLWTRSAFAYHEASHAAVALDLGLKVEFVAIDENREIEVTELEATLYPVIKAGMKVPAICTRLDPEAIRRKPFDVMAAMVAPSCVQTGNTPVDDYAATEAFIAVRLMKARGMDPDGVLDRALRIVRKVAVQDRILDLAKQLTATGWVDLA